MQLYAGICTVNIICINMQIYAIRRICKNMQYAKTGTKYAINMQCPMTMPPMWKYAKICKKYSIICKICQHDFNMQNMHSPLCWWRKYSESSSSQVKLPFYQINYDLGLPWPLPGTSQSTGASWCHSSLSATLLRPSLGPCRCTSFCIMQEILRNVITISYTSWHIINSMIFTCHIIFLYLILLWIDAISIIDFCYITLLCSILFEILHFFCKVFSTILCKCM